MSVIIFGANGFLGSVIANKLYHSGFEVLPVIRPGANKSRLGGLGNLSVLEVESTDWPQIISRYNPNTIICAQWDGVLKQNRNNLDLQKTNLEPILNIAIAANQSKVETFVCFGSQAEATESVDTINEVFYDSGKSPYGVVKSKLHSNLTHIFDGSDCRFIWARVFSVYGPSDFSDSLLTQLFESQISKRELIIASPLRFLSYLYEDDFASAIEQILKNHEIKNTVNIGNPIFNQISEIEAVCHGNSSTNFKIYQVNQDDVGFFPQLDKLRMIGWNPSTSLYEGIQKTRKVFTDRVKSR